MCMAIPARVLELKGNGKALADIAGRTQEINVPIPDVSVGEYVLLYLGTALSKIEEGEAKEILQLWYELSGFTSKLTTMQ